MSKRSTRLKKQKSRKEFGLHRGMPSGELELFCKGCKFFYVNINYCRNKEKYLRHNDMVIGCRKWDGDQAELVLNRYW